MNRRLVPSLKTIRNQAFYSSWKAGHCQNISIYGASSRSFVADSTSKQPRPFLLPKSFSISTKGTYSRQFSSSSPILSLSSSSSSSPSSVSSDEISKFSSMASTWWEPDQNPLISMNPTRMEFIINTLQMNNRPHKTIPTKGNYAYRPLDGLKALDVGCGGGLLSESLARLGANVTAIDPSEKVARAAYEHSKLDPTIFDMIDYRGGTSVEDLALEFNGKNNDDNANGNDLDQNYHESPLFDVICILEVIEHATDPKSLIESAISLLKKPCDENPNGGVLFISTINRTAKSYAIAIVGGEYVTGKLPIGTHSWCQFKTPQEVHSLVGKYGLREANLSGMVLKPPFFDLRWKLNSSDTDINWIGAYCHQQ